MFDEITEYSSDIEWLLQDKQAKEYTILKALVPEHFERTLWLAFLISMDPEEALLATCETFASALVSRHGYSSDQEVQEWLDQILITTCQGHLNKGSPPLNGAGYNGEDTEKPRMKTEEEIEQQLWQTLDALPYSDRLPYLLNTVLYIPVPQVARLLGLKEGKAGARLEITQKLMLSGLNGKAGGDPSLDQQKIGAWLTRSFQKQWESERLLSERSESMITAIQTLVEEKRRERRKRVLLQEILLVVIVVVLVFTLVQVAVTLSADPSAGRVIPDLWSLVHSIQI